MRYNIRGWDSQGCGLYGMPRGKGRKHKGIDLVVNTGDMVLSHVSGVVTKLGYPYAINDARGRGKLRYVQITDARGLRHRFMYVSPYVKKGAFVRAGSAIGLCQNLQSFYPGITSHVHYEIKTTTLGINSYVNPVKWLQNNR